MFQNKKIKELQEIQKTLINQCGNLLAELSLKDHQIIDKDKEIAKLQEFNKRIDDKIEELCKPKIDAFCLSLVGSGLCVSTSAFSSMKGKYDSLDEILDAQSKKIEVLEARDEETKKILFLAGKVEQLLNQLKKGK